VRVLLIAVGLAVVAVAALAVLAWLADRQLNRDAAPYMTADIARVPAMEVALVLGAAPIGPEGGPNRYLAYRLDAAAALWKAGKVKYLIASGAREGDYDEPTYMRAQLIERGVPASAVYCDYDGVRTLDSILRDPKTDPEIQEKAIFALSLWYVPTFAGLQGTVASTRHWAVLILTNPWIGAVSSVM